MADNPGDLAYLWQTSFTEMHVFPQGLPLVQCFTVALAVLVLSVLVVVVTAGGGVEAADAPAHSDFLAILPLASWQLPFASRV